MVVDLGLQNQSVIFVQENLEDKGTVFLDPNLLSDDGTVALSGISFSEDGKTLAYGLSASGSDWIEIRFKNVETGKICFVSGSIVQLMVIVLISL